MIRLLQKIDNFEGLEGLMAMEDVYKVISIVCESQTELPENPDYPERLVNHAAVVKELARIFSQDKNWQITIEANQKLAKTFRLDSLIGSHNPEQRKLGCGMGSLLMMKLPRLQIEDILERE